MKAAWFPHAPSGRDHKERHLIKGQSQEYSQAYWVTQERESESEDRPLLEAELSGEQGAPASVPSLAENVGRSL